LIDTAHAPVMPRCCVQLLCAVCSCYVQTVSVPCCGAPNSPLVFLAMMLPWFPHSSRERVNNGDDCPCRKN
jgi:hypothetical protein